MSAKFTSDVKGRIVNEIECSAEEAERLQADESKTFYVAPSIAPRGFVDFSAGMTIFPVFGTDGGIKDTVMVYEVLGGTGLPNLHGA
jgi:hypothetical protein